MSKLVLLSLSLMSPRIGADKLDKAMASAMFAPSSSKCQGAGLPSPSTSFNTTYTSTTAISKWDVENAQYEDDVFLIDMIHSDNNENRSWTLRLGKGGQIVSFIVASGEAISNQADETAAWNDLVQQMVAVNSNSNTPNEPSFIHQAGPYMKDTGYGTISNQNILRRGWL
jgi:hypothetical protein